MDDTQDLDPRSVIVTTLDDAAGLQLDVTALHQILCTPELADTPLAVISIAGCLRTGKSFLLSFLTRYLRNRGWENPEWIGDDDTVADDGIKWQGGKAGHTEGIVIWNEIFTVQKEDGKKIAVLLMDTQGLFDRVKKEENTKLFTMAVLLSSFLMLNIKCQIDERELEYLELFVEYASATEKDGQKHLFQDLMFLIRDWQHDEDNAYGFDGGNDYVNEELRTLPNSELNNVRQNVQKCFQSLECFLMPHPGLNVTKRDFRGRNADIRPEFLEQVSSLAERILHPDRIQQKTHKGKSLTGHSLWQLLVDCNDMFRNGSMPSVDNMVMATSKNTNSAAYEESLVIYEETMNQECSAKPIDHDNMDQCHAKAWTSAIEHFEKETRFGGEQHRASYRQHLIEKCQRRFTFFTQTNELQKVKAHNFSIQKVHELWTDYKMKMRKDIGEKSHPIAKLQELHKKHQADIVKSYQTQAGEHLAFIPDHLEMLKQDVLRAFEKMEKINGELEMLELLGGQGDSCRLEYEGYLLFHSISQQYRDEFEKFTAMYVEEEELENQNNILRQSYFQLFEDTWSKTGPNINIFREQFMNTLKEECKAAVEINERNKRLFESLVREHIMNMKVEYRKAMDEITRDSYVNPEDLDKGHKRVAEKLLDSYERDLAGFGPNIRQDRLDSARNDLEVSYAEVKKENEASKQVKPALDSQYILSRIQQFGMAASMLSLTIIRYTSHIRQAKSAYNGIKSLVPTVRVATASSAASSFLPVAAVVGATAAAGTLVVVTYCVYRHYKQKKQSVSA